MLLLSDSYYKLLPRWLTNAFVFDVLDLIFIFLENQKLGQYFVITINQIKSSVSRHLNGMPSDEK